MNTKIANKKNYIPFAAGMLTMVMLIGLISASFAKNEDPSGQPPPQIQYGQVGVGLFLQEQIAAGETLTTEKGAQVPKVLTYTDEKGEDHYFLEASAIMDLFDVADELSFNQEVNRVEFGAHPMLDQEGKPRLDRKGQPSWFTCGTRHDFDLFTVIDEKGNEIVSSASIPVTSDGVTFNQTDLSNMPADMRQDMWDRHKSLLSETPEYGESFGMFTEVDPAEIDLGSLSGVSMNRKDFQDENEVRQTFGFTPQLGRYAAITIENTGTAEVELCIRREYTVGGMYQNFSSICIPAGGKIVRAFLIDEDKPLENQLTVQAAPLGEGGVHLKLTAEQYRAGVNK